MKKILLSESAKALVLAFAILVSYAGNIMAQATYLSQTLMAWLLLLRQRLVRLGS